MTGPLRLLSVHAHPDDEASKGAATVARYVAEGCEATLVCCTGGEAGDILNPAMDRPEVHERLGEVRLEELARSVEAIGYQHLVLLGYRDSGMPDSEANADPACFARASLDEATGRLVAALREARPHVVITYGDDQKGYPHPDHLQVHDVTMAAWDAVADPSRYPEAGDPWQPSKLYYSVMSKARVMALHEGFAAAGLESPFDQKWLDRPGQDDLITTRIDISDHYPARTAALRAHATQIDPDSKFWFGLPDDVVARLYPTEDFQLAQSLTDSVLPEDDLFAGLR